MKARTLLAAIALVSGPAFTQDLISARSGFVNFQESRPVGDRRQLGQGEVFRPLLGRAEVLLSPGSFVRLERDAAIRMLSTQVIEPHVELLSGMVSVEVIEIPKQSRLVFSWGPMRDDRAIVVVRRGLYRMHAEPNALRIYVQDGKLRLPGRKDEVKRGNWVRISASGSMEFAKFDRKFKDSFDLWNSERAALLSRATETTARSYGRRSITGRDSIWAYNSFLGYYTFLPFSSYFYSPWGYAFYSPRTVWITTSPSNPAVGGDMTRPPSRGGLVTMPQVSAPAGEIRSDLPPKATTTPRVSQ